MPDAADDAPTDHPYGGFSTEVIELLRVAHSATPLHQLLGLRFVNGPDRDRFAPGDVLFVPAGVEHRFEEFTDDLALWAMFCTPQEGRSP